MGPQQDQRFLRRIHAPGQVVSVDQLVSPALGFIPPYWGRPTINRYVSATLFVDHFSDFTYIHLMEKIDE